VAIKDIVLNTRGIVRMARNVRDLYSELDAAISDKEIPHDAPEFSLQVGWAESYDTLFRGAFSDLGTIDTLISTAALAGRVLLTARGGSGKSQVLYRLARANARNNRLPVFIDFASWSSEQLALWVEGSRTARMDQILRSLAVPQLTLAKLDGLPSDLRKIFLVDGLSEVRAATGDEVLMTLDDLVTETVGASMIAADRLVRRDFRDKSRWRLATLLPISDGEISRHLKAKHLASSHYSGVRSLLREPFFLDATLRDGVTASTSTSVLQREFVAIARLSDEEFAAAAQAALECYKVFGFRSFPVTEMGKFLSAAAIQKMITAGLLLEVGKGHAHFAHQLHHDFLASTALALRSEEWNNKTFDAVSLGASSFDTIAMTLERLDGTSADSFLRRVYDWNPYAASYAMAECRRRGTLDVTSEIEVMILAMLANRLWDVITASAIRAKDALNVFPSELAGAFLAATRYEDIFATLKAIPSEVAWFNEWRKQFTQPLGGNASEAAIRHLSDTDSVAGWTMANVLKRLALTPDQIAAIRWLADSASETVQWRVAHVLGSFPTTANAEFLLQMWDGAPVGGWVRYGAIRSLVELAAVSTDRALSRGVVSALQNRAEKLVSDTRSLWELARSLKVRDDLHNGDWVTTIAPLVRTLYEYGADDESREKWRVAATQLFSDQVKPELAANG